LLSRHCDCSVLGPISCRAQLPRFTRKLRERRRLNWRQIAALYERLLAIQSSTVLALNHAVAVAMGEDLEKGLALINQLGESGTLDSYYLHHAARADLLRRLGRLTEAAEAYKRALALTANAVERRYLRRRLTAIE
jgi:RNA polymerase sigma-70 factor (ECF subfamily)